jgi:hypothetical protein
MYFRPAAWCGGRAVRDLFKSACLSAGLGEVEGRVKLERLYSLLDEDDPGTYIADHFPKIHAPVRARLANLFSRARDVRCQHCPDFRAIKLTFEMAVWDEETMSNEEINESCCYQCFGTHAKGNRVQRFRGQHVWSVRRVYNFDVDREDLEKELAAIFHGDYEVERWAPAFGGCSLVPISALKYIDVWLGQNKGITLFGFSRPRSLLTPVPVCVPPSFQKIYTKPMPYHRRVNYVSLPQVSVSRVPSWPVLVDVPSVCVSTVVPFVSGSDSVPVVRLPQVKITKVVPESVDAPKIKNRGVRGGKRVLARKPGFCYLKNVPKKSREIVAEVLGSKPEFHEVAAAYRALDLVPRGTAHVLVGAGYHVVKRSNWPTAAAFNYLVQTRPNFRVGSQDWDDFEEQCFRELYVDFNVDDALEAVLPECDKALSAEAPNEPQTNNCDMAPSAEGVRLCEVRGKGDCWKKMGAIAATTEQEFMTAAEMLETLKEMKKYHWHDFTYYTWTSWEWSSDGDLHIEDWVSKRGYMDDDLEYTRTEKFIEALEIGATKYVGTPAVPRLEANMQKLVSPETRMGVEKMLQPMLRDTIDAILEQCPYAIPEKNQHLMEDLAIPFTNFGQTHSHPIHAATRRLSYMELVKYIKVDCTIVSSKRENFETIKELLSRRHGGDEIKLKHVTPILDIRDIGRYAGEESVPMEVWSLGKIDTPMAFFDECGHYMSPGQMLELRRVNPQLRIIAMTNIFPLMSLQFPISPEPNFCEWRIQKGGPRGDTLIYIPEGDEGGNYQQPFDPTMTLLRRCEDERGAMAWTGGVVWRKANTRLQIFTTYHVEAPHYIVESQHNYIMLPRVFRGQPPTMPIRLDHFTRLLQYAKTLQNSKANDIRGKLRLMAMDKKMYFPPSTEDWVVKVVEKSAKVALACGLEGKNYSSIEEEVHYKTIGHLKRMWQKMTGVRYAKRNASHFDYSDPVSVWPTLNVRVALKPGSHVYAISWKLDSLPPVSFWNKFVNWLSYLSKEIGLSDKDFEVRTDEDGYLYIPGLANTRMNQLYYGDRRIMQSQADDYNRLFRRVGRPTRIMDDPVLQDRVEHLKRAAKIDGARDVHTLAFPRYVRPETPEMVDPFASSQDDLSSASSDSDPDCFARTDSTFSDTVSQTSVEEAGDTAVEDFDSWNHCKHCPTMSQFVRLGGKASVADYIEYAMAWHSTQAVKPPSVALSMQRFLMRMVMHRDAMSQTMPNLTLQQTRAEGNHSDPRHLPVDDYTRAHKELLKRQAEQLFQDGLQKQKKDEDKIITIRAHGECQDQACPEHRGLNERPDTDEDHWFTCLGQHSAYGARGSKTCHMCDLSDVFTLPEPPEVSSNVGVLLRKAVEGKDELYRVRDDNVAGWTKLLSKLPTTSTLAFSVKGGMLWDAMYPKTVSQRWHENPYSNVVEWAKIKYPDNDCLLRAVANAVKEEPSLVLMRAARAYPRDALNYTDSLPLKVLHPIALSYGLEIRVVNREGSTLSTYGVKSARYCVFLRLESNHVVLLPSRLPLTILKTSNPTIVGRSRNLVSALSAWPALQWVKLPPSTKRAEDYLRALAAGTTGTLGNSLNLEKINGLISACDMGAPRTAQHIGMVVGDPGCRKSSYIQAILRKNVFRKEGLWAGTFPTNNIRTTWADALDARGSGKGMKKLVGDQLTTFEVGFATVSMPEVLILDENRYPKGYIDAMLIKNPQIRYTIFACDPWQSSWHEHKEDCYLNRPEMLGEAEYRMQYAKQYLWGTWRCTHASFFRMPTFTNRPWAWAFSRQMPTQWTDLQEHWPWLSEGTLLQLWNEKEEYLPAHVDVMLAEQMRSSDAATFAGSIGRTATCAIIVVDERCIQSGSDPRLIYTAMTRSNFIFFVQKWREDNRNNFAESAHPVFGPLSHYRKNYIPGRKVVIVPEHTVDIRACTFPMPKEVKRVLAGPPDKVTNMPILMNWFKHSDFEDFIDPDERTAGSGLDPDDPIYQDDPTIKSHFVLIQEPRPREVETAPIPMRDPVLRTKVPTERRADFIEHHNSMMPERFDRELMVDGQYSMQFPDLPQLRRDLLERLSLVADTLGGPRKLRRRKAQAMIGDVRKDNPLYYSPELLNWGADQRRLDEVSFKAAIAQRIKYTSVESNLMMIEREKEFGNACFHAFRHYLGIVQDVPFDQVLYDFCVVDFDERRNQRTQAEKKGSLNRAQPEFTTHMDAKQQWKAKERGAAKAKPLQPIMTHSDQYLFEQGPRGMYILKKLQEIAPKYWFFYAGKSPDDFKAWTTSTFGPGVTYAMGDQTGQDGNATGWAVVFFEGLMNMLSVPPEWLSSFRWVKVSNTINGKILQIMTDSGEIWTFLLNTCSQAGRECFMYDLQPGDPMASGGDDTMRLAGKPLSAAYLKLQHLDPCLDKRFDSDVGEFCSFRTKNGILVKDPVILLKRFMSKISQGAGEDAVKGYFDLWRINYVAGEELLEVFDEEDFQAHQIMTRMMFNLKKEGLKTQPDWSRLRIAGDEDTYDQATYTTWAEEVPDQTSQLYVTSAEAPTTLVQYATMINDVMAAQVDW